VDFRPVCRALEARGTLLLHEEHGLQNQSVFYVTDAIDGQPRILLDPNTWSKDGTVALAGQAFSEDGKYLAYARSEAGSDWATWRVMDLAGAEKMGTGTSRQASLADHRDTARSQSPFLPANR